MNILAIGGGRIYAGETATIDQYASSVLPSGKNIAILPTASGDRSDYIDAIKSAYEKLGISSRVIYQDDLTTKKSLDILKHADGLYIGGGDVRHLLEKLDPSFVSALSNFIKEGKLVVGLSAGCAILFEKAIFQEGDKPDSIAGLGFLAGGVLPHYDQKLLEVCKNDIESALRKKMILYGISDGTALHFKDTTTFETVMESYSRGVWKIFEESGNLRAEPIKI